MTKLIEWKDLCCAFDGRTIFEGFSGTLDVGERVRVTGASGCGKTTFLSMLRTSFRRGMTEALAPHIANMAAAGLVILPGMMTGVMIGGASPVAAVEYQWLLLLAVFAAKSITIALAMELAIRGNRLAPELK